MKRNRKIYLNARKLKKNFTIFLQFRNSRFRFLFKTIATEYFWEWREILLRKCNKNSRLLIQFGKDKKKSKNVFKCKEILIKFHNFFTISKFSISIFIQDYSYGTFWEWREILSRKRNENSRLSIQFWKNKNKLKNLFKYKKIMKKSYGLKKSTSSFQKFCYCVWIFCRFFLQLFGIFIMQNQCSWN